MTAMTTSLKFCLVSSLSSHHLLQQGRNTSGHVYGLANDNTISSPEAFKVGTVITLIVHHNMTMVTENVMVLGKHIAGVFSRFSLYATYKMLI
ncbi:hypothetical protein PsorP6_004207 [Peronosclerospora sorghi]|uniref:Uncharacterized protein n=1 Tax=Peronosclerospora sorghi TaxID=230839 RepID=A0ACC0VPN2_9STRA|nr:hypothetical protein PsorP6_004207 [Peronosclerospora sorghi]